MKTTYTLAVGLLCAFTNATGQSMPEKSAKDSIHPITVEFNRNVEFLGYALHMGEPEPAPSAVANHHPMRKQLDEKRNRLNEEESLTKAFELGYELPYSFFVELFAKMHSLPHAEEYPISESILLHNQLNTSDEMARINKFMEHINTFYRVSEFDVFWTASQDWYAKTLREITQIKPEDEIMKTMENFYEQHFLSYKIIPSLTLWSGPGFGFREDTDQGAHAYFVLGPFTEDYRFDQADRLKTLAIHEFGHSFVNHLLETTCRDLIEDTAPLFAPLTEKMAAQGYLDWPSCVNEHFVRAGEVLIPELMNDLATSKSNLKQNAEGREFIYLPFIVDRLRKYRIEEGLSYKQSIRKAMLDLKKEFRP